MLDTGKSITAAQVDAWRGAIAAGRFDDAQHSDAALMALIESAERLKDACSALQARATHEFSERRLSALAPGSAPDREARHDIASRIARARHISPFHGRRHLELSRMLVRDLPRTLDALAAGQTTEHRASLIAQAAACLGTADRAALDENLGPRLSGKGNRAVQGEADRIAAELDAAAVVERHRLAAKDRRVTLRPAPDTMTYLTALLPVADGVATWAALDRHATLATAAGDRRSRGQLMADELAQRLLYGGAAPATLPAEPAAPPVGPQGLVVTRTACRVPAPESGGRPVPPALGDGDSGGRWQGVEAHPVDFPAGGGASDSGGGGESGSARAGGGGADRGERPARGSATGQVVDGRGTRGDGAGGSVPATHPPSAERPTDALTGGVAQDAHGQPTSPPPVVGETADDPPASAVAEPDDPVPAALPAVRQIDLMLVMTDRALLDGADTAAVIPGFGPVPAALARGMLADADPATRIFLRRLYTDPTGEQLLTADARGRLFPHAVRQFVLARDQRCRTPFCDATIRHIDHAVPHSAGGPTSLGNEGGLCERCSLTKGSRTDDAVRPGPSPRPPRSAPWDVRDAAVVGAR